jgi:hypothetical protein
LKSVNKFLVVLFILLTLAIGSQGCNNRSSKKSFGGASGNPSGNKGPTLPPPAPLPFSVELLDLNYNPAAPMREVSTLNGGPLMVLQFESTESVEFAGIEVYSNRPNLNMVIYTPYISAQGTEVGSMYNIAPVGTALAVVQPGQTVSITLMADLTNLGDSTVKSEVYYITWREVGDITWTRTEVFGLYETILVEPAPEATMLAVAPVTTNMVTKSASTLVATLDLIETSGLDACELQTSGLRIVGEGDTTTLWLLDENDAILAYATASYYSPPGHTDMILNLPNGVLRLNPGQTRRLRIVANTTTVTATSLTLEVVWFQLLNLRNEQYWTWIGPHTANWAPQQFTVNFN